MQRRMAQACQNPACYSTANAHHYNNVGSRYHPHHRHHYSIDCSTNQKSVCSPFNYSGSIHRYNHHHATMTARVKSRRTHTASSMTTKYHTREMLMKFSSSPCQSRAHHNQLLEKQKKESMKKKKKKKPKPLTDKQRAAAAREHYELHHTTWTPDIEGHHNNHNDNTLPSHSMDHTLLPPVQLEDMIQYIDNLPHDHENLQQFPWNSIQINQKENIHTHNCPTTNNNNRQNAIYVINS